MRQLSLEPLEGGSFLGILVAPDQIPHILTNVFLGTMFTHLGGNEFAQWATEANRHSSCDCPGHGSVLLLYLSSI